MIEAVVYSSDRDTDLSSKLLGGLTLLTLLLNPYLSFNTFHGLETAFHILFFAVATYFALQDPTTKNVVGLVMASFISVMIRPDALAFVFPLWSVLIVYSVPGNQRRKVIAGFLALSIALGIYSLLKWWWFGYPFPNTFYIKQGGLLPGLGYVRSYFDVLSLVWFFLVFALGRVGISKLVRDKKFVLLLLPAIVFCLAYVGLKPTLGQGYRFLIPTLPLIILACLRTYILSEKQSIQNVLGRWNMPRFISEVFAIYSLVMLLLIAFFGYKMYRGYKGLQNYFGSISQTLVPIGHNLRRASGLSPPPLLATGDIGAIPYYSKLPTMDIIGLADETVAHEGLTHEYLLKRNPDLLILQDLYLIKASQAEGNNAES
jgi:hypothetical protein